jgi:hypothetical protein
MSYTMGDLGIEGEGKIAPCHAMKIYKESRGVASWHRWEDIMIVDIGEIDRDCVCGLEWFGSEQVPLVSPCQHNE